MVTGMKEIMAIVVVNLIILLIHTTFLLYLSEKQQLKITKNKAAFYSVGYETKITYSLTLY